MIVIKKQHNSLDNNIIIKDNLGNKVIREYNPPIKEDIKIFLRFVLYKQ